MSFNMALATEANNIINVVSNFRHKKMPNTYNMVDIKPSITIGFRFTTYLAEAISPFSSQSAGLSPQTSIRKLSTLPIRVLFTNDMLGNPFTTTFPRAEVTPNFTYKRWRALEFLTTTITAKALAISLLTQFQKIENVHIYRFFSSVNMLRYLRRCHCRIIGDNVCLFFFSPAFTFQPLCLPGTLYRTILTVMSRFGLKFLTATQTLFAYHNSIISQNFI